MCKEGLYTQSKVVEWVERITCVNLHFSTNAVMGKTEHFCADGLIKSAGVTMRIQHDFFYKERDKREQTQSWRQKELWDLWNPALTPLNVSN